MKRLGLVLLLLTATAGAAPYRKIAYCSMNRANPETYCGRRNAASCVTMHTRHQVCDSGDELPWCCRANEKKTFHTCGCCGDDHLIEAG